MNIFLCTILPGNFFKYFAFYFFVCLFIILFVIRASSNIINNFKFVLSNSGLQGQRVTKVDILYKLSQPFAYLKTADNQNFIVTIFNCITLVINKQKSFIYFYVWGRLCFIILCKNKDNINKTLGNCFITSMYKSRSHFFKRKNWLPNHH